MPLKVNAVQCPSCKDIIFSRAQHDFHSCTCKQTSIDGGFDYTRVGYAQNRPAHIQIELIGFTPAKLYDDWNDPLENQYGVLHTHLPVSKRYRYTLNAKGKLYRYRKNIGLTGTNS